MLNLRIGICDDEASCLEDIKKKITQYIFNIDINITFQSFLNPYTLLETYTAPNTFHILFLDIEMPEMSGLLLAEKIKKIDRHVFIVFISNYPKYMQDSFRIHPFYYLVKPLTYDVFTRIMNDIISNIQEEYKYVTLLRCDDKEEAININDIYYIEVTNGKKEILCFHFFDHNSLCHGKLNTWIDKLSDFIFFQCHRGILINMAHIHYFKPGTATMDNGEDVPLSRAKEKKLKDLYSKKIVTLKKI